MPTFDLRARRDTEDHLWRHGLYLEDVYDVIDENRYKVFANPPHADRLKLIGYDRQGRLLTVIVTSPDKEGVAYVVTAMVADAHDAARYRQPGGRDHV